MDPGSSWWFQATGQETMAETDAQEVQFEYEEVPYCEGDQTQEQVAWRCCEVSLTADVQELSGNNPVQHALVCAMCPV